MPLEPGEQTGKAIRELHTGKTYARTRKKFGKKKADRQAIAIAIANRNKAKKRKRTVKRSRKTTRK
jgi:hypothetical protein